MVSDDIREAAEHARTFFERLGGEGGLLHQLELGELQPAESADIFNLVAFIQNIGERVRIERILLERLLDD